MTELGLVDQDVRVRVRGDGEVALADVLSDPRPRTPARARFDPETVAAEHGVDWGWHHFKAGDGTAIAGSPSDTAQIRTLGFNRGLSKIVNHAFATPNRDTAVDQLTAAERVGQIVTDPVWIGRYGYRSWSAPELLSASEKGLQPHGDATVRPVHGQTTVRPDARASATWEGLVNGKPAAVAPSGQSQLVGNGFTSKSVAGETSSDSVTIW